ncbi:hypothetical protein J6590_039806 [Homalodisca vitripennis]|nr:hypothetical protein J6590_095622 [Homalodisca vitripennis]KAG8336725.1 hypothetical protein J6590_039806 [Homalodisca vitripennis]
MEHFITPRVAGCRLFVKYTDRQSPVLRSAMELATSSVKKFGVIRLLARLTSKFTVWKAERRWQSPVLRSAMELATSSVKKLGLLDY